MHPMDGGPGGPFVDIIDEKQERRRRKEVPAFVKWTAGMGGSSSRTGSGRTQSLKGLKKPEAGNGMVAPSHVAVVRGQQQGDDGCVVM